MPPLVLLSRRGHKMAVAGDGALLYSAPASEDHEVLAPLGLRVGRRMVVLAEEASNRVFRLLQAAHEGVEVPRALELFTGRKGNEELATTEPHHGVNSSVA